MRKIPGHGRYWKMNNNLVQSLKENLLFHLAAKGIHRFRRRKLRVAILVTVLVLTITTFFPIKTVRGLVSDTGLCPAGCYIASIDSDRIAVLHCADTLFLYDIPSAVSVSFSAPTGTSACAVPHIQGNKVVVASITPLAGTRMDYCIIPKGPLAACGAWTQVGSIPLNGITAFSFLETGGFPQVSGDIMAWPTLAGFSYYRFSSGITSDVTTAQTYSNAHVIGLSIDNGIIAFAAKPTAASASADIMYYDTNTATPSAADTGLPGLFPSISANLVVFEDNSSSTVNCISSTSCHLRFDDILRSQASPAGTGPLGTLGGTASDISGNRIAFAATETDLGIDCDGNGVISSSELCLRYWNVNAPSFVASLSDPAATPAIAAGSFPVISGDFIAFPGTNGHIQFVRVPIKGDINQDGKVDTVDFFDWAACQGSGLTSATTC